MVCSNIVESSILSNSACYRFKKRKRIQKIAIRLKRDPSSIVGLSRVSSSNTDLYFLKTLYANLIFQVLTFSQCGASRHFVTSRVNTYKNFSFDSLPMCLMTCYNVTIYLSFFTEATPSQRIAYPAIAVAAKI